MLFYIDLPQRLHYSIGFEAVRHLSTILLLSLLIFVVSGTANTDKLLTNDDDGDGDNSLIVQLPNGKIRGSENDQYYSYESIPYAEPPIGELRFEAPRPYTTQWTDTFNASKPQVLCMQWNQFKPGDDQLEGVEDCLTLSVYKPKSAERTTFPVFVLIHGGAFMFGGAALNQHERFMRVTRMILVKISYRVGPLGFLSTENAILPGNYGLKDQRLALQWIKSNIANFGGEPENILVFGHSSGGAAVHLQMLQANFKNLAKVAVSMSGVATDPWVITHKPHKNAIKLGEIVGCATADAAADVDSLQLKNCLKTKNAEEIVRAVREFLVFGYVPFTTFGPTIEPAEFDDAEAFLKQNPADIIKSGNFAQVPWLVSYTKDDGGYNAAILLERQPETGKELIELLNERWLELGPYLLFYKDALATPEAEQQYSKVLKEHYLGASAFNLDNYRAVQQMFTDVLFKNGTQLAVELHAKYGSSPVYANLYDNPSKRGAGQLLAKRDDVEFGTVHADDFYLIFSSPAHNQQLSETEERLSNNFLKMLENFANNENVAFGDCQFVNNVGAVEQLQLMKITRNDCRNEEVKDFP